MISYENILKDTFYSEKLQERLVRYAKIETTSDSHVDKIPSTECQRVLAKMIVTELTNLGITDIYQDEHLYTIAKLPATKGFENKASIGFMAHMDTAHDAPGKNVNPIIHTNYDGKKIVLKDGFCLDPEKFPNLVSHIGDTIITTDGTTLLGGDDKAGMAEIITAVEYLLAHPEISHGPIEIIFTPDEETGKGMDLFPLEKIASKACYTMDGSKLGEIEAECFNAWKVDVEFNGNVIHLGDARGKLVSAVSMAAHFVSMLPRSESPEATDGWFGYYCATEITAQLEKAHVELYLRDFTIDGMNRRLEVVRGIAKAVEGIFGGKVILNEAKQYLNMRQNLDRTPHVLARAIEGVKNTGIEPFVAPIRGGTDGARLTERGIPTPNIFTGAYNYHSRLEWASVSEMVIATKSIIEIIKLWAK